jgi:iron complex outermembrane receptor protein
MTLQAYYDRTHLRNAIPALTLNGVALAPPGILQDDLDTYDFDFQHRFALNERNRLVWGLGYRLMHDVVQNSPSLAFIPETLNRSLYSVFVQDEIGLADNLALTLGTKVEHNDYTAIEVEPNIRLQWDVAADQTLWGAISRAVRMPSRVDRHERISTPLLAPMVTDLLVAGDTFISETVVAYELGYRAQFGKKVTGSIALFYNDYDRVRSTSTSPPTPFPFPLFFENNLDGETHGFELNANYQVLPSWRLQGSYFLLNEHLHVKPGRADFNNALNETADPRHQVTVRSSMELPRHLELDGGVR